MPNCIFATKCAHILTDLWVCCAPSLQGRGNQGRVWGRSGQHILACSPRSYAPSAAVSSWTQERACRAAL